MGPLMIRYISIVCLSSMALSGCAIPPVTTTPPAPVCGFAPEVIELPLADQPKPDSAVAQTESAQRPTFESQVEAALDASAPAGGGRPAAILALSGGSQHGAFGAGFLDGWRESSPDHRLPEFDVVTGISTGSILATFAFIGRPQRGVERYRISNESELLSPIARNRPDGSMSPFEIVRVLRRGAVADLTPLRNVLLQEINPEVMAEVARRHALGRKLYVGAVDVDNGQAMAFDLTRMATRYVAAGAAASGTENDEQRALRTCYVNAIIASSSAPLAAVPVFIDNQMYVDGGMRFGMFADDVIGAARVHNKRTGQRTQIYVIANGYLETDPRCGKPHADTPAALNAVCPPDNPTGGTAGSHVSWSLLNLALRSEDVLVNQIYRFSADRIIRERELGNDVWFARIRPNARDHMFAMEAGFPALATLAPGEHSCRAWEAEDEIRLHPVQFYPRYMHCLVDYGRIRGAAHDWNIGPLPVAPLTAKP